MTAQQTKAISLAGLGALAATLAALATVGKELGFVRRNDLAPIEQKVYRLEGNMEILIAREEAIDPNSSDN